MADFNPKTIKGNIGGVYFTKTKEAVDPFNLTKYNPNTNQNIILFYLEDGVENNIVTVNFAPKDSSMPKKGWTSHDFPAIFRGYVDHTVNGEAIPRTFAQYLALVPTLVTDLNLNNKKPLSFNATVIQQSGVNLLGSFNTLQDLINAHTPTESLHDNDAIAYVYENEQNGYYKVYFSSGSSTWYWGLYDGAISTSLDEVQYNLTGLQVQGGFRNPAPIVPLQDEQYRIIWQHLNELYAQYSEVEGELGDLEQELIELNTVVVKSISKTDTNTVSIGLTRVDNNVDIHAVVNVANNSYNLLKVVSGGLEVDRYDIINEITFEINNTNSSLRQAIDNIVDNKISVHNNDNQTHQDIRVDIANLQKNKVDKVAGKGLSSNDFTTTEKNKLASIEAGAEVNPTASEIKTLYESNANTNAFTDTEKSQVSGMYNDNYFKGVSLNSTNYVITFTRRDNSTVTIDLPLESVVVSGAYEDDKIILTLQNGSTIEIPLGDLIDGLMSAPSTNKGETTNKTLTYGGTFKVLEIDTNGTITERVMTLPALPTKAQVGLGNVDNTSDLNKPISTATQTALNDKVDKVAGKGLSSNDFTTTEKNKLASIEAGAEVNPTASEIKTLYESNANTNAFTDTEKSQVSGMYNDNYFKGVSLNSTNYVITFTRRDNSTVTIDLPLESVVVSGAYEDDKIILTLQNGSTIEIPLGDLIDGLMSAPSTNKGETTNKTLTYGGTFKVLEIDTNGTITERVMTLPALPTKAQVGLGNVDNTSDLNKPISTATQTALNDKVDKVAGKGLSTNDYTTADKNLVATITNKANTTDVNNGLALKVNIAGNVTITGTKDFTGTLLYDGEEVATIQDLSTVFRYKGSVETYTDLPTSGQQVGDVYNVNDTGKNYAWSGTLWDDLGGTVDLSIYATKTELTSALSGKVDKVAGKQLSTEDFTTAEKNKLSGIETGAQVNTVTSVAGRTGAVVLTKSDVGLGNVDNTSDLNKPISTATQTALDKKADKTELFSGSYNDLTDKPTLFSGSYNDLTNKPTIPTKTSQLTNDSGFATETYVNNKVASVYKYKGSVETFADLPTTNRNVGDVYDVKDTGMNYAWNGTEWDALGTVVDLSIYATKTELTSGLSGKVDKVAGKQLSTEDFTTAEKTKLSGIATNAQVNVLEGVQLNGTDVAISSKKSNIVVNKTTVGLGNVPNVDTTNPANITQNATHRFVTDTEKATWNGKQNALGFTPENVTNKVTAITSASTDTQYPTAKAVYDMIGDIESVIDSILGV